MSVRNNSFINLFLLITLICSAKVISNEIEMEQQKKLDFSQLLKHVNSRFQPILQAPEQFRFQVIYTMVHRNQFNEPTFETFQFGMKDGTYFYPASAIKFPIAVLALEKLNNISSIDMDTPMEIEDHPIGLLGMNRDETSHSGYPSIAHFIINFSLFQIMMLLTGYMNFLAGIISMNGFGNLDTGVQEFVIDLGLD